jgi:hypothetical protein
LYFISWANWALIICLHSMKESSVVLYKQQFFHCFIKQVFWTNWNNFLRVLLWWKSWLPGHEITLFPLVNACLQEYLLHIWIKLGKRHDRYVLLAMR